MGPDKCEPQSSSASIAVLRLLVVLLALGGVALLALGIIYFGAQRIDQRTEWPSFDEEPTGI